ncbi:MAG TPA: hypothetical protein VEB64_05975, partial [Azospirillaceae bacterium]|nr:hypothetical protein [Azospirillaceae bacterium]
MTAGEKSGDWRLRIVGRTLILSLSFKERGRRSDDKPLSLIRSPLCLEGRGWEEGPVDATSLRRLARPEHRIAKP